MLGWFIDPMAHTGLPKNSAMCCWTAGVAVAVRAMIGTCPVRAMSGMNPNVGLCCKTVMHLNTQHLTFQQSYINIFHTHLNDFQ